MAYPAVDPARCDELAELAKAQDGPRGGRFARPPPTPSRPRPASAGSTIGILVDLDVGLHRTGVQTPGEALELRSTSTQTAGLRLDGIMFYPGHVGGTPSDARGRALRAVERHARRDARPVGADRACRRASSPAARRRRRSSRTWSQRMTEIRPGTYVFNDMNCVRGGVVHARRLRRPRRRAPSSAPPCPGQIVIDAGTKTLTSDRCGPAPDAATAMSSNTRRRRSPSSAKSTGRWTSTQLRARRPKVGERVTSSRTTSAPASTSRTGCGGRKTASRRRFRSTPRAGCTDTNHAAAW